jgi:hypothetical protein
MYRDRLYLQEKLEEFRRSRRTSPGSPPPPRRRVLFLLTARAMQYTGAWLEAWATRPTERAAGRR